MARPWSIGLSGRDMCLSRGGTGGTPPRLPFPYRQILLKLKNFILSFGNIFRSVGMILYLIYRYMQTISCRGRECPRHQVKIYKGCRTGAPRALCIDRKRSLTPRPHSGRGKRLHNLMSEIFPRKRRYHQLQSPLFSVLPAEVRLIIYQYAIGGLTVHVSDKDGRLISTPLVGFIATELMGSRNPNYAPLALLRACRKIYAEAIGCLYTSNTLLFSHPLTFFDLSATTLPGRFRSIRSLRLCFDIAGFSPMSEYPSFYAQFPVRLRPFCSRDAWDKLWGCIATDLVALESLELVLHAKESKLTVPSEIFKPMWQVRRISTFRVMICFSMILEGDVKLVKDANFTIQYCDGLDQLHLLLKENSTSTT